LIDLHVARFSPFPFVTFGKEGVMVSPFPFSSFDRLVDFSGSCSLPPDSAMSYSWFYCVTRKILLLTFLIIMRPPLRSRSSPPIEGAPLFLSRCWRDFSPFPALPFASKRPTTLETFRVLERRSGFPLEPFSSSASTP